MSLTKNKCLYCDGKKYVKVLGEKGKCPWCYPRPGHIHAEYADGFTCLTTYGKDGKKVRQEVIKHKTRRAKTDGDIDDSLRLQHEEASSEG